MPVLPSAWERRGDRFTMETFAGSVPNAVHAGAKSVRRDSHGASNAIRGISSWTRRAPVTKLLIQEIHSCETCLFRRERKCMHPEVPEIKFALWKYSTHNGHFFPGCPIPDTERVPTTKLLMWEVDKCIICPLYYGNTKQDITCHHQDIDVEAFNRHMAWIPSLGHFFPGCPLPDVEP